MPRLWTDTVNAHRHAVREATLEATAALVAERGVTGVTMSKVAERAGIGRATLYKYFPDVESILVAWHERQVGRHLEELDRAGRRASDPAGRLAGVFEAYALMIHDRPHGTELAAALHRGPRVAAAHERLTALVRELLSDAAATGTVRSDIPLDELAAYALHALDAASGLQSGAAVGRLVAVTLDGLRPRP